MSEVIDWRPVSRERGSGKKYFHLVDVVCWELGSFT